MSYGLFRAVEDSVRRAAAFHRPRILYTHARMALPHVSTHCTATVLSTDTDMNRCSDSSSDGVERATDQHTQVSMLMNSDTHKAGSHFVWSILAGCSQQPCYHQSESRVEGQGKRKRGEKKKKLNGWTQILLMNREAMAPKMLQCNSLISAGLWADKGVIWRRGRYGNI